MDGGRDSEIAMGAFQPNHITANRPPRGHIYGFRRALWHEHLGDPGSAVFDNPETEECIKFVNGLAQKNWELYSKETFDESNPFHHLLRYPVEVTTKGTIINLPGFEYFPDTKAKILGSKTRLPAILTT